MEEFQLGSKAIYHQSPLPEYAANPLISSLRPPPKDKKEALMRLGLRPKFNPKERELDMFTRISILPRLDRFWVPSDDHLRLMVGIYSQIVNGYLTRNPLSSEGQRLLHHTNATSAPGSIALLVGHSGMGKSTLLRQILTALSNQFIQHIAFNETPFPELQVAYLHRNVPEGCTPRLLGSTYGEYLDEQLETKEFARLFSKSGGRADYSNVLARVLIGLHTGILVVDELQNLSLSGVGASAIWAMLINFRDQCPVPIIAAGTYKSLNVIKGDLSTARRVSQGGSYELRRPESSTDPHWLELCQRTWSYQWVRKPIAYSDAVAECLYELTGGITAIMLSLFKAAQGYAILSGVESVTIDILILTWDAYFRLLNAPVKILMSGDPALLLQFDELYQVAWPQIEQNLSSTFPYGPPGKTEIDRQPGAPKNSPRKNKSPAATSRTKPGRALLGALKATSASEILDFFK